MSGNSQRIRRLERSAGPIHSTTSWKQTAMLNIALFGPPGAGKGTQSEHLVKEYNLLYISTGDLLRQEIADQTPLGIQAQSIIAAGGLVSDEIIVQIIEKTIIDHPGANGFLFDGFPRTYVQAYILEGLMLKLNTSLNCLLSLNLPEEVCVERLLNRGKTSGRSDDNETVIRNRLREYNEKTIPVLSFYREKGICYDIDGTRSIEEVTRELDAIAANELKKQPLNIVLFGYPGSGRDSQGKALAERYGLEFISTNEMLENEIRDQTEIGKTVIDLYNNGQQVPDEIVVQLIERRLNANANAKGFIFKGLPRTLVQSYILDGLLKKRGRSISIALELEVPLLDLVSRLDERGRSGHGMSYDSSVAKIIERLREHESKTLPVIAKYAQQHGLVKVDGTGTFDEIFSRLCAEVEKSIKNPR